MILLFLLLHDLNRSAMIRCCRSSRYPYSTRSYRSRPTYLRSPSSFEVIRLMSMNRIPSTLTYDLLMMMMTRLLTRLPRLPFRYYLNPPSHTPSHLGLLTRFLSPHTRHRCCRSSRYPYSTQSYRSRRSCPSSLMPITRCRLSLTNRNRCE